MIKIYSETEALILDDAWDYSLDEIDYLLEKDDHDVFVLIDGRLWEAEEVF